jgi:anti-sigma regulatory factor (Ser/Thr protein kinase)
MAKRSRIEELVPTVTADVVQHPTDLTRVYAQRLGVSRVAANKYVRDLEKAGWIARSGPSTRPIFSPGYKRQIMRWYELQGLEEDVIWQRDFRPYFQMPSNIAGIVAHGFSEIVNNAVDHSGGKQVLVWLEQDERRMYLIVSDDGIGIFRKIATALDLPDIRLALFELSKGKLTTDPTRHSGEGVFFTSRMFDLFLIVANGLRYSHFEGTEHDWLRPQSGLPRLDGTAVHMSIDLVSERTTAKVYAKFTDAPHDSAFSKTVVPMKLAQYGDEQLISRSQAKRVIARFDRFKIVVLDFEGVSEIGQAFADELFRVYPAANPTVELLPTNMSKQVESMWSRAIAAGLMSK